MILQFLTSRRRRATIPAIYGAIVAQAREPAFYRDLAVPDTANGRYDMIVLHLSLLLDRFEADPQLRDVGQGVFDRFCVDLDDHFREQGVGDLRVPKEMQKLAEAFYGRRAAYRDALARADDLALESALMRNIYHDDPANAGHAAQLARYVRAAVRGLTKRTDFANGALAWPDARSFAGPAAAGRKD
jgi:cytochrome b pre-mRNA-processing protein 3